MTASARGSAILEEAARLATVEGLDGLSLARLADEVGMSKSGLFAHFGSKEELQLATVETAREIFDESSSRPALNGDERARAARALRRGVPPPRRGWRLPRRVLLRRRLLPSSTRARAPCATSRSVSSDDWRALLEQAVQRRAGRGLLDRDVDAVQLAFELNAYLLLANANFVASGSPEALAVARRAVADRLERELVQPGRRRPSGR